MELIVKDVAQFLKVLADEARLQMLWLLFNHRELCVCDLMEALGITQSKASRHLATLRHAGLVIDRREAAWSYYSICPAKNELEHALLDAVRVQLVDHPGAAQVLHNLHTWMKRKDRDVACAAGGACGRATKGKRADRARAPLSGGNR
jgi:ArsR family transcriptional regulator, arsenate/arsenite/antimonite-responsive transcriptional repressor